MSTLNVAVADEKKNMQSLLKGMEFLGTAKSSDEAYSMINANAGSDVVLVYVKRASGDTEPLDDTYMQKKSLETQVTDIIHEIGVPAHIKGYQYLRTAIVMCVEDMEMLSSITKLFVPHYCKEVQDYLQQGGESHKTCHRGGMEQRQDGYDRLHVWIHCKLWQGQAD